MSADAGAGAPPGAADGATDACTPNDGGLSTAQFGSVPGGFWGFGRMISPYPARPEWRDHDQHKRHMKKKRRK